MFQPVRSVHLRLLTERGDAEDWQRTPSASPRRRARPPKCSSSRSDFRPRRSCSLRRGDTIRRALLLELEQTSGIRRDINYATNLPELVRSALTDRLRPAPVRKDLCSTCVAALLATKTTPLTPSNGERRGHQRVFA